MFLMNLWIEPMKYLSWLPTFLVVKKVNIFAQPWGNNFLKRSCIEIIKVNAIGWTFST